MVRTSVLRARPCFSACPALFLRAPGLISSVHASSFSAGYHKQHF